MSHSDTESEVWNSIDSERDQEITMDDIQPGTTIDLATFEKIKSEFSIKVEQNVVINPPLGEHNWVDWHTVMSSKLRIQRVAVFVNNQFEQDVKKKPEYIKARDLVYDQLISNMTSGIRSLVAGSSEPNAIWSELKTHFEGGEAFQPMAIFSRLYAIKAEESRDLKRLLTQFRGIVNDARVTFDKFDDSIWIGALMALIPKEFAYVTSDIGNAGYTKVEQALGHIEQEHLLSNQRKNRTAVNNLNVYCGKCGKAGHHENQCEEQKKRKAKKRKPNGGGYQNGNGNGGNNGGFDGGAGSSGGFSASSGGQSNGPNSGGRPPNGNYSNRTYNNNSQGNRQGQGNRANQRADLIGCLRIELMEKIQRNQLIVPDQQLVANLRVTNPRLKDMNISDSACAAHMVNSLNGCIKLDPMYDSCAYTANGESLTIEGVGQFMYQTSVGFRIKLTDVLFIPDLESNFISTAKLDRLGFHVTHGDQQVQIFLNSDLIERGELLEENLYRLNGEMINYKDYTEKSIHADEKRLYNVMCLVAKLSINDRYLYFHRKFAHLNFGYLQKMRHRLDIKSLPEGELKCGSCILAKFSKLPFELDPKRCANPLDLIHTDVSGRITVENDFGYQYYVTFIDDYSRNGFTYLMKYKSETYAKFLEFKAWIEKETDRVIKRIRSDNGGEYTSKEFESHLIGEGIQINRTCPRNPQQNPVAERKNRSLCETARVCLLAANLPSRFWPSALMYADYTGNRIPNASIGFQIPYELFFCRDVNFTKMRDFGERIAYLEKGGHKFEPNGRPGIFLGYAVGRKGFIIYDPEDHTYFVTRDIRSLSACKDVDKYYSDLAADEELHDLSYDEPPEVDHPEVDRVDQSCRATICQTPSSHSVEDGNVQNADSGDLEVQEPAVASGGDLERITGLPQSISALVPNRKIVLNYQEEELFRELYPNVRLQYDGPHNSKRRGVERRFLIVGMLRKSEIRSVPKSYKEAVQDVHSEHYISAMMDEYSSVIGKKACKLVPRPPNTKIVNTFWVFSLKPVDESGVLVKPKARIVANGLRQQLTPEAADSYAPVIRPGCIKLLLSIALKFDLLVYHVDVKSAFLNSDLNEKVYLSQFPGFVDPKRPDDVYEAVKALYGLHQSGKCFHDFLVELLEGYGLKATLSEPCIFKPANRLTPLIGSHVDDLAVLVESEEEYKSFASYLKSKIEITEKGEMKQFIGLTIKRTSDLIEINQTNYIEEMLERYGMANCNPVQAPSEVNLNLCPDDTDVQLADRSEFLEMLGSAMYVTNGTRADGAFLTNSLCKYMIAPTEKHMKVLKRFMRYFQGTKHKSLVYRKSSELMVVYGDASFGGDVQSSKSVSGVMIFVFGNLIDWVSRRQSCVALSTCESEVLAIRDSAALSIFYRDLLDDLQLVQLTAEPTLIYSDNQSAVLTLKNGGSFSRSSHYRIRVHFLRDLIKKKFILVKHLPGREMFADILTKSVSFKLLADVMEKVGLVTTGH